jgi:antitoxin component YwqK of YwqJK toxin-antitoxin module
MPFKLNPSSIALLLLLTTLFACNSNVKEVKTYFKEGGQLQRQYKTVDGKIEGIMTEYYPSGKVKMARLFQNGLQTGNTVVYFEDGKIKESQYFENGLQVRGDTIFYPTGTPELVVSFKDGKRDGYLHKYNPDGTVFFEALYEKDALKEVKGQKINPPTMPAGSN